MTPRKRPRLSFQAALQALWAKLPDPAPPPAGGSGEGLWAEAEPGTELTHPSAATFFFDVLMFQFWQPVRQRHQAACPSSLLTPEQLLAGLSGDFKGGKLPWDSFSKAPSQCEHCEGEQRSKWGQPSVMGKMMGGLFSAEPRVWKGLGGCPESTQSEPEGCLTLSSGARSGYDQGLC